MGDMGLYQQQPQGSWRTRWTDDTTFLRTIMASPNPWLTGPMPPPPLRQFPREPRTRVYDSLMQLQADNTRLDLAPWQVDLLERLGIPLRPDPLADVRRQVQEWLDGYQPQPASAQAWAEATKASRLAHLDQLMAAAADPYRYTPLQED